MLENFESDRDDGPPVEAQTEFQGTWTPSRPVPEPDQPNALEYNPLEYDW